MGRSPRILAGIALVGIMGGLLSGATAYKLFRTGELPARDDLWASIGLTSFLLILVAIGAAQIAKGRTFLGRDMAGLLATTILSYLAGAGLGCMMVP